MKQERFLSLYDYLGKAAGKELGAEVAFAAMQTGIPTREKKVENPLYKGKVMMYPENWLIGYFSTGQSNFKETTTVESLLSQVDLQLDGKIYG